MTNEEGHRALWTWLTKTGANKHQWPEWDRFPEARGNNSCFACTEAIQRSPVALRDSGPYPCHLCPIVWNENGRNCESKESPFEIWKSADYSNQIILAKIIAELPWRPAP